MAATPYKRFSTSNTDATDFKFCAADTGEDADKEIEELLEMGECVVLAVEARSSFCLSSCSLVEDDRGRCCSGVDFFADVIEMLLSGVDVLVVVLTVELLRWGRR